ncbi:unnamed protein product [Schistosoma mattheei]|uniref:Uncharacterized protein n=1 Tax=Schistosoma mattheei TaxID=31246 RepID=A0A183NKU3_9TREM|nr:unnamed protein product [Schistosoma mattheei]
MAVRKIKSGNALGPDNLPAAPEVGHRSNCKRVSRSIQVDYGGQTSADRLEGGYLINMSKKEDLSNCENCMESKLV